MLESGHGCLMSASDPERTFQVREPALVTLLTEVRDLTPPVRPVRSRQRAIFERTMDVRKSAQYLAVIVFGLTAPFAYACKPLVPAAQIRAFVAVAQPPDAVVFAGEVISVKRNLQGNGDSVTSTTVRPLKWWMGFRDGLMVIRTTTSASVPCPNLGVLNASVGEKWLVGGSVHNTLAGAWVELRASMRLDDGRLPSDVERELRRIKVAD